MVKLGENRMKRFLMAGAGLVGMLWLGSCATMSAEQCQVGDWEGRGFADGGGGLTMGGRGGRANGCGGHGIAPDAAAYAAGREDGLLRYCTVEGGFEAGRRGNRYAGVCPGRLEADFLPAYRDGEIVHEAESALSSAQSALDSARNRAADRDEKLAAKERELRQDGLTDQQRDQIRDRIREVREELNEARRDMRTAEYDLRRAKRDVDDVRYRFSSRYGHW